MHPGWIGVVQERGRAISGHGKVALAQLFRGAGQCAVRTGNQRVHRQEAPRVLCQTAPVFGRKVELD